MVHLVVHLRLVHLAVHQEIVLQAHQTRAALTVLVLEIVLQAHQTRAALTGVMQQVVVAADLVTLVVRAGAALVFVAQEVLLFLDAQQEVHGQFLVVLVSPIVLVVRKVLLEIQELTEQMEIRH